MYREYDLFEKFPDGSSIWRASALGLEGTRLHLRELARKSNNEFYAIDILSGKIIHSDLGRAGFEFLSPRRTGKRSKSAVA
jgi:hypothetical protein